jgi:Cu-Zn family superoxide dismutase
MNRLTWSPVLCALALFAATGCHKEATHEGAQPDSSSAAATSAAPAPADSSAATTATSATTATPAAGTTARATLKAASGDKPGGTVTFNQQADGVHVAVDLTGATPGKHGVHIHQNGECTPPFKTAGDHFNPDHAAHACSPTASRHTGDIGNVEVKADGTGHWEGVVDQISLSDAAHLITGKSVIVHAKEDDCKTQPSGASGDRIACGVIESGSGQ